MGNTNHFLVKQIMDTKKSISYDYATIANHKQEEKN